MRKTESIENRYAITSQTERNFGHPPTYRHKLSRAVNEVNVLVNRGDEGVTLVVDTRIRTVVEITDPITPELIRQELNIKEDIEHRLSEGESADQQPTIRRQ